MLLNVDVMLHNPLFSSLCRASLWAYPGANKHGYLLKQLHNSKVRKCVSSQNSNGNRVSKVTNCKVRDCTSSLIPNQSSSMVNSNGKITDSASLLTQIRDKKQCGGNSDEAQVYTLRIMNPQKNSSSLLKISKLNLWIHVYTMTWLNLKAGLTFCQKKKVNCNILPMEY